jgi:SAM-dependent methyltransferase
MGNTLTFGDLDKKTGLRTFKARARNWRDEIWDRRFGVSTFGMLPAVGTVEDPHWQVHYEPTSYGDLFKMLQFVTANPGDVFLDLGCGLGRAVFAATHLGVKQAIGVEINRGLFDRCQENLKRLKKSSSNVQFHLLPAQDYMDNDATVLYLFNPFGEGTMNQVLARLGESLAARPRKVRLIYFNPLFESVLESSGFLRMMAAWPEKSPTQQEYCKYKVSFWEN